MSTTYVTPNIAVPLLRAARFSTPSPSSSPPSTNSPFPVGQVLQGGIVGTAYSETLTSSSGTSPFTFALQAGSSLPAGMTLSSAGVISGTPTTAGTTTFTVVVTDANGNSDAQAFTIIVAAASAGGGANICIVS